MYKQCILSATGSINGAYCMQCACTQLAQYVYRLWSSILGIAALSHLSVQIEAVRVQGVQRRIQDLEERGAERVKQETHVKPARNFYNHAH